MPEAIQADAARAVQATLGAALSVAESMEQPLGAELANAAREAFTQAFRLAAAVSAVMLMATALLAYAILGRVRGGSVSEARPERGSQPTSVPNVQLAQQGSTASLREREITTPLVQHAPSLPPSSRQTVSIR
jgi:hypothetical protein